MLVIWEFPDYAIIYSKTCTHIYYVIGAEYKKKLFSVCPLQLQCLKIEMLSASLEGICWLLFILLCLSFVDTQQSDGK